MLVRDVIRIFKKYTKYKKDLKDIEEMIKSGGEVSDLKELYKSMHEEYVRFMSSPVSEDLLK